MELPQSENLCQNEICKKFSPQLLPHKWLLIEGEESRGTSPQPINNLSYKLYFKGRTYLKDSTSFVCTFKTCLFSEPSTSTLAHSLETCS